MANAKSLLTEAAHWERRVRDVDSVFASEDLQVISDHLAALQRSVSVMRDMPEHAAREAMLAGFKERFEKFVRPVFVTVCPHGCVVM